MMIHSTMILVSSWLFLATLCWWRTVVFVSAEEDAHCIECHVVVAEVWSDDRQPQQHSDENDDNLEFQCWTKLPGRGFRQNIPLTLPSLLVQDIWSVLVSGQAHVCLSTDYLQTNTTTTTRPSLVVPDDDAATSTLQFTQSHDEQQEERRRLVRNAKALRLGPKRLLAVRIVGPTRQETPLETTVEIRNNIFGDPSSLLPPPGAVEDGGPLVTVVSQYAAISHGALQFLPATGDGIENGVAEVQMDTSVLGADIEEDLMFHILNATAKSLGDLDSLADHIIFCLPNGSQLKGNDSWTAFTYLFEPYSYYQKSRCTRLSIPIHEMGHSLGFKHSGTANDSYADESGYMGYAVNKQHYPRKAFNAHKHWISGWFDHRAVALEKTRLLLEQPGAVALPLVSFVDASRAEVPEGFAAVVRIGDLYFHYNRAKGYNKETSADQKDMVTITFAANETAVSIFMAALTAGDRYSHANFDGKGNPLVIQVCDLAVGGSKSDVDYAVVSIHVEDGLRSSLCGGALLTKDSLWAPKNMDSTITGPNLSPTASFLYDPALSPTAAPTFLAETASSTERPAVDLNSNVVPFGTNNLPNNSYLPEVLVEEPQYQHDDDDSTANSFDPLFVMLLAIAGALFVLAGGAAYCAIRHSKQQDNEYPPSLEKKKTKPPDLDLSETEDSERDEEDCIVEIRRIHPLNDIDEPRFCEI